MDHRPPHVVALCGSLRDDSCTRTALGVVLSAARAAGGSTDLLDLRRYDLPMLNAETDATDRDSPTDAAALRETIAAADAVVLGTPNYHGSYSGALKNALDHCGREEFAETTVGLLEVAAGSFPGSALIHLRTVSRTLRAWTLPTEVAIPNSHSIVTDGGITDDDLEQRTHQMGEELVDYAGVDRYPEIAARGSEPQHGIPRRDGGQREGGGTGDRLGGRSEGDR